jgi:hypothetical protein
MQSARRPGPHGNAGLANRGPIRKRSARDLRMGVQNASRDVLYGHRVRKGVTTFATPAPPETLTNGARIF